MSYEQENYNKNFNGEKPENFTFPPESVTEKPKIAEQNESKNEKAISKTREVSVADITPADLLKLDEKDKSFVKNIIDELVAKHNKIAQYDQRLPILGNIETIFDAACQKLARKFPHDKLSEIVKLPYQALKEVLLSVAEEPAKEYGEYKPTKEQLVEIKTSTVNAVETLRKSIQDYAAEKGYVLKPKGVVRNFFSNFRNPSQEEKDLKEQLALLDEIKVNGLKPELLKHKMMYRDERDKDFRLDSDLKNALRLGAEDNSDLSEYLYYLEGSIANPADVIADKLVQAFQQISQGYGQENYQDSEAQFKAGEAFSAGGGNQNYSRPGVIEKVRIKNE